METVKTQISDKYIRNLLRKQFKAYGMTDEEIEITQDSIEKYRKVLIVKRHVRALNKMMKKVK